MSGNMQLESRPVAFGPDGHRWELDDKRLKMAWFTGPNAASDIAIEESDLEEVTEEEEEEEEEMDDDYDCWTSK